jgi:hypothetical protein
MAKQQQHQQHQHCHPRLQGSCCQLCPQPGKQTTRYIDRCVCVAMLHSTRQVWRCQVNACAPGRYA